MLASVHAANNTTRLCVPFHLSVNYAVERPLPLQQARHADFKVEEGVCPQFSMSRGVLRDYSALQHLQGLGTCHQLTAGDHLTSAAFLEAFYSDV